jgi:hypothetical protein
VLIESAGIALENATRSAGVVGGAKVRAKVNGGKYWAARFMMSSPLCQRC